MWVVADFHNHSCLSPCASLEMSPAALVETAASAGVRVLALTDHNSALNTPAFEAHCRRRGVLALCGLEVTTVEELHCLCLFATCETALEFSAEVERALVRYPHNAEKWGDQVWVDERDEILGEVAYSLASSTSWSIETLERRTHELSGLFVPAHIDRARHSISSQLGYLPDLRYDALEIRDALPALDVRNHVLVKGSDAHYLENVATRTCRIDIDALDFDSVREALLQKRVRID